MKDSIPPVYTESFRIRSYDVDKTGRARPDILMSFLLESAWAHTRDTEFSYDQLNEEGQLWVLSRFLAVFHSMPRWNEEVKVETWGKGIDRLFGLRDFAMYSKAGDKLVSATSAWLIVDRKTQRVQRIESLKRNFPAQSDRHELETRLGKIEELPATEPALEHVVRYSDLDVNKHVNSAKYMQWILDSFPAEHNEKKNLKSFEANYLSEALLGETIVVSSAAVAEGYYCSAKRAADGTELCRAAVKWK